ncbi:carbonic anhydrase [Pseudarthrobacter sp. S3]|uniref:carbonic anhydrase n=1 Tax=Pseudarthrobacter sp. S3 TaxID=3418419 RepID=UPI003CF5235C
MRSATIMTRKSLLVGSGLGLVALITGCGKPAAGVPAPSPATPAAPHAWSYDGAEGPDHWGALSSDFGSCSSGTAQSPIDVGGASGIRPAPITLAYSASEGEMTDNGHTTELRARTAQGITVEGKQYDFKQMHFHAPSEHTLEGVRYEAEFHFVHQADDGGLAVIGILATVGATNAAWAPFTDGVPAAADGQKVAAGVVDFPALFPASLDHVAYDGSLTTPPCSEGVRWLLLETTVELGAGQLAALRAAHAGNNRPVQPLNGRDVAVVDQ